LEKISKKKENKNINRFALNMTQKKGWNEVNDY
jgi:hypothetical protein